ncbi:MAG: peptide-methionine (S)-S-oxide reductase MsrA [Thermoplasmatota archaeon]
MPKEGKEVATLGGGCFWCVEAALGQMRGVDSVVSGYSGGQGPATYDEVCSGGTGHAEVVQVTYDPSVVSYRDLLEAFFTVHDPTTLNRQGADEGTQYRSVIFTHSPDQDRAARDLVAFLQSEGVWEDPIVTEIAPFEAFYPAEAYHQNYYELNPYQGYCQAVIRPKLSKFRKKWAERLKA